MVFVCLSPDGKVSDGKGIIKFLNPGGRRRRSSARRSERSPQVETDNFDRQTTAAGTPMIEMSVRPVVCTDLLVKVVADFNYD